MWHYIDKRVPRDILLFIKGKKEDGDFWYGLGKAYRITRGPKTGGFEWITIKGKKIEQKVSWWAELPCEIPEPTPDELP